MEKWNGDLSAAMEFHGESWCGVPVRKTGAAKWCGNLTASTESHGKRVWVPHRSMESHEKSEFLGIVTPAEFCSTFP